MKHLIYELCIAFLACSCSIIGKSDAKRLKGTNYYISTKGSDSNNGLDASTPWQTLEKVNSMKFQSGDSILFCVDEEWKGQLAPKGSGDSIAPIVISSYGQGKKPHIAGGGISGIKAGALLLYNQDYWVVDGLQLSNTPDEQKSDVRFGILIRWHDYGTGRSIKIQNCDIFNVAGDNKSRFHGEGILVIATGKVIPTNYDNVVIEGCSLKHVDRTGISVWSQWQERGGLNYGAGNMDENYHGTSGAYKASTNVVVRGNYLEDIGGDGILVSCTDGALIEKNRVYKANQRGTSPNAGIWPHNSDRALMQYNEVSHTGFSGDGQGFDIDLLCFDCISQYNYSHDNAGGSHLICSQGNFGKSSRNIIRYNISQNDKRYTFTIAGSTDSTYIYNNKIYTDDPETLGLFTTWMMEGGKPDNTFFYNNIIYYDGKGENCFADTLNFVAALNCWYGNNKSIRINPNLKGSILADPMFIAPGTGKSGMNTLDGYKLDSLSPVFKLGFKEF